jgi:ribonuclease HII
MLKPFLHKGLIEAGLDEAGRGPLLGRVYTAAVILPQDGEFFDHSRMKDSKKFSNYTHLLSTYSYIKDNALDYSVSWSSEKDIDEYNIRNATFKSMHKAIDGLNVRPDLLLVDGNDFIPYIKVTNDSDDFKSIPHCCIIKGDNTFSAIAAASILAKVEHDKYILDLCEKIPILKDHYGIHNNKGYGAKKHLDGIHEHGITEYHRKTFGICKQYTN